MALKSATSLLLRTLAGLVTLLLIVVLLVLFVNRNDQPPSQAALQMQRSASSVSTVADSANGYIDAMGVSAPDDADAHAVGLARAEWIRKRLASTGQDVQLEFPDKRRPLARENDPAIKRMHAACKKSDSACADAMNVVWMPHHAALFARYEKLLSFKQWRELWPSDMRAPLLQSSHVLEGQSFLFIRVGKMAHDGDVALLKPLLQRDHQFWRMVLAESSSLIGKLIAAYALEQHYKLANLVLRRLPPVDAIKAIPDSWHLPTTERERSMLRVMANEWEFFQKNMTDVNPRWIQRQATSNLRAERMLAIAELFALDYSAIPAASQKLLAMEKFSHKGLVDIGIYNFSGAYVVNEMDMGQFVSSGMRVADVEAMRRLTMLAADMRARGIKPDTVLRHLQESDVRSPFDGKPFDWDAADGALGFARRNAPFQIAY